MENYAGHELTVVSFDTAVPSPPERRCDERQTTLLRIGKLVVGGEQRLCMIRNLSSAGAMLKLYQPLALGERVQVEVTPDCPVDAQVIWYQDGLAGIAFDTRIDVVAALRGGREDGPYRRVKRIPRVRVERAARMCTDDAECAVMLCDISPNGAKIAGGPALAADTEIALFVEGLPPLTGSVRWCGGGHAGIKFDVSLRIDLLAGWLGPGAPP
ncbi:MAG: PilZ domain-containing protein [Sphingomonas sp.]